jgi:Uma2 family endonuclease
MPPVLTPTAPAETVADLLDHLGGIPPARLRLHPPPGTATEQDVLDVQARTDRLCELVDGVLVEKAMGFRESFLAITLSAILWGFVQPRKLGVVTGADGMMRLSSGLVRIPDVAFISWERLPGRRIPREPIPALAPDLAVEVLSPGNTPGEMARKRQEYFAAGVQVVWIVDPVARTVAVYTAPEHYSIWQEDQMLAGDPVLLGFTLSLRELFAALDSQGSE